MLPDNSPYARAVHAAAQSAGALVARADLATPSDIAARVLVVDLTRVLTANRLGPRVIAISEATNLDCYDVIRPDDVAPNNTVQSKRLANAQITYRGTGDMAATARAGWGTSGLLKLWPF